AGAADTAFGSTGYRRGMDIPNRRYVALARDGASTRGRATVPPARARTQPARPAAALCQLPGARGNPRAPVAETGRLRGVEFSDLNEPGDQGQVPYSALSRRSGGPGQSPRATTTRSGRLAGHVPRRQAATVHGI